MVLWHHRRSKPRSFFRQMYRFAIGRLQIGKKDCSLLSLMHILAAASPPVGVALAALVLASGHAWLLPAAAVAAYAAAFAIALPKASGLWVASLFPFVLATFLVAWSLGFLRELLVPLKSADGK
jgi:hypothetical protein